MKLSWEIAFTRMGQTDVDDLYSTDIRTTWKHNVSGCGCRRHRGIKKKKTEQVKRGHKEKGRGNKELSLNKDTEKGGLLLSPIFVFHCQLNPFVHSSFWLCLSVWLFHALWLSLVFFVCVCQRVTWSVIRVSGTELSHTDRARPPLSYSLSLPPSFSRSLSFSLSQTQAEGWLDWASDRAWHGLTGDSGFPLKGQTTMLHHIWNSQ